jgi:hypothetical protein
MTNQPLIKSITIWGLQLFTVLVILFTFFGGNVFPELYTIQNPFGLVSGWTLLCFVCVLWLAYINDILGSVLLALPVGVILIGIFWAGQNILKVTGYLLLTTPLIENISRGFPLLNPILIIALSGTLGGMVGSWVRKAPFNRFIWNLLFALTGMFVGILVLLILSSHLTI